MDVTTTIYFLLLAAGVVAGALRFRMLSMPARWLWALFIFILTKEGVAIIMAASGRANLDFYKFLGPVDFVLTAMVFLTIPLMKRASRLLFFLSVLVLVFYLLNITFWQPLGRGQADTNFKLVRSTALIVFSLVLFLMLARHADEMSLYSKSNFWLCVGVITFNATSIFYWGAYNYFLNHNSQTFEAIFRPVFITANYIQYGLLAFALFRNNFTATKTTVIHVVR